MSLTCVHCGVEIRCLGVVDNQTFWGDGSEVVCTLTDQHGQPVICHDLLHRPRLQPTPMELAELREILCL